MNQNVESQPIDLRRFLTQSLGLARDACENKTVVITGAGRGIGLQCARAFAFLGGKVVIAEISSDTGQRGESLIRAEGGEACFIQTDVSDASAVAHLASECHRLYGPVEILVNNAILCPVRSVLETDVELWDQVIAVNLRGTFLTTRAFLGDMVKPNQGVIINMVSMEAMPGLSAYIATKQGIAGFSQSLAIELHQSGVSVIPFAPGMVDTPSIQEVSGELAPRLGMTRDQFMQMSLHPEYEGLMPPEHAGAATAYLALKLAQEFRGEIVNGYEVLERAGYLKPAAEIAHSNEQIKKHDDDLHERMPKPANPEKHFDPQRLVEYFFQVEGIISETRKEFDQLPVFIRPIAKSGFKSKAGQSLDEWEKGLARYQQQTSPIGKGDAMGLIERLEKLQSYYRGVPTETARFSKDKEFLRQVAALTDQRITVIQDLADYLAEIE